MFLQGGRGEMVEGVAGVWWPPVVGPPRAWRCQVWRGVWVSVFQVLSCVPLFVLRA